MKTMCQNAFEFSKHSYCELSSFSYTDLIMKQTNDIIKQIKKNIAVQDSTGLKTYIR